MTAVVVSTQQSTPDTTRSYTVRACSRDVTNSVAWKTLGFEDQGASVQATTSFRINASQLTMPEVVDQGLVEIEDHIAGGIAFRGFIDSRVPGRAPLWDEVVLTCSAHDAILDNVIPFEQRPVGESDAARIGYLWGLYAGPLLQGTMAYVQQVDASLPEQIFASVSLRRALDLIAAQASPSAFWYLDNAGRLHYGTSETNDAPKNVTSDTTGAGEIYPMDLQIDWDSKQYVSAVYVRGKTVEGSGWVYGSTRPNGLAKTRFLDAADSVDATMRDALGNAYLARVNTAKARGSFRTTSDKADGWRSGQNVNVRSTHLNNINQAFRIAKVKTKVLGPYLGRPAALRQYTIEFGNPMAGQEGDDDGPVVGTSIIGDILDDGGNLLLGTGSDAATAGFGAAIRRYITSGVYNSDFSLTPPLADATIVQTYNPLPFWRFVQANGSAITARTVADSGSGSGRVLQFDMAAGAAGDDSYIEQIIPVNASRSQAYAYKVRVAFETGPTVSVAKLYIVVDYLKNDGVTTTGTGGTTALTTTSVGALTITDRTCAAGGASQGGQVPTDAYYLRLRVGFQRDAAATSVTETLYVLEAHMIVGPSEVMIEDIGDPTNLPARIIKSSGATYFLADGGGVGTKPYLGFHSTPDRIAVHGLLDLNTSTSGDTGEARIAYDPTNYGLLMGDSVRAKPITPVGFLTHAYAADVPHLVEAPNSTTLTTSGGSVVTWFRLTAPMLLYHLWLRTATEAANSKTLEWSLYLDRLGTSTTVNQVTNAEGTFSFTGASNTTFTSTVASPPLLAPGLYFCVLRNTHATNTLVLGLSASVLPGIRNHKTKAAVGALGATIDLNAWTETSPSRAPYLTLVGEPINGAWQT